MLQLGKMMRIPLLEKSSKVMLGDNIYTVGYNTGQGYFLNGHGVSNRKMFWDLECEDPYKWCRAHNLRTNGDSGTFPFMEMDVLRKAVSELIVEFRKKGKHAQII